jgi:ABC-type phosphate transport system permease subunit
MSISFSNLTPISSIVFGVLILIFPRFLNYLIAGYLILTGIIALGILR